VKRNARVTSSFCTLVTTIVPSVIAEKNITALLPHCPGDNHASPVRRRVAMIPKAEGLKICLLLNRKIYLDATVRKAASRLVYQ
jgi:hypothetical protein